MLGGIAAIVVWRTVLCFDAVMVGQVSIEHEWRNRALPLTSPIGLPVSEPVRKSTGGSAETPEPELIRSVRTHLHTGIDVVVSKVAIRAVRLAPLSERVRISALCAVGCNHAQFLSFVSVGVVGAHSLDIVAHAGLQIAPVPVVTSLNTLSTGRGHVDSEPVVGAGLNTGPNASGERIVSPPAVEPAIVLDRVSIIGSYAGSDALALARNGSRIRIIRVWAFGNTDFGLDVGVSACCASTNAASLWVQWVSVLACDRALLHA